MGTLRLLDMFGTKLKGEQKMVCELTVRAGQGRLRFEWVDGRRLGQSTERREPAIEAMDNACGAWIRKYEAYASAGFNNYAAGSA